MNSPFLYNIPVPFPPPSTVSGSLPRARAACTPGNGSCDSGCMRHVAASWAVVASSVARAADTIYRKERQECRVYKIAFSTSLATEVGGQHVASLQYHTSQEIKCILFVICSTTTRRIHKISPPLLSSHLSFPTPLPSSLTLYLRPEMVTVGSASTGTSWPRDMSITWLHLHRTASPAGWNTFSAFSENSLY